ncbi:MAG: PAS domain S-box protein [Bacillota bacterium]
MSPFALLDEESAERFHQRIKQWLSGEKPDKNVDYKVIAKDGKELNVLLNVKFTQDENGVPLGAAVIAHDITARKKAEEALKESEERLLALMTATSNVIYRMSPDWKTMTKLYGRGFLSDTEEADPNWLDKYIHPDDQPFVLEVIQECIEEEKIFALEHRVFRADGGIGWTYSRAVPLFDEKGKIREWFGAASDITQRKRTEEALRRNEERQAYLLSLSDALRPLSDAQSIQDAASRILAEHLKASQVDYAEYYEDLGYSMIRCESLDGPGRSAAGNHKTDDYSAFVKILKSGSDLIIPDVKLLSEVPEDRRARLESLGFRAHLSIPFIKNGALVATLTVRQADPREWDPQEISIVRETAERTWAAVERAKAEEALKQSEEKYRLLFDSIDEGFCIAEVLFDKNDRPVDYRFLEVNRSFERQTGLADAAGRRMREMAPDNEQHWFDSYGRIALTGEPARFQNPAAALGRFFDVYAFRVGRPEQRRVAMLFNDITERKQTEAQAQQASDQLGKRNLEILDERRRLFDVLEALPVMICLMTPDHQVIFSNRNFQEKFGESEGRRCYEYCCGYSEPCSFCEAFVPLKTGQPHRWEFISPIDDSVVDAYDLPFSDTDGSPLILEMDIDITERKRAEKALRESRAQLEEELRGARLLQGISTELLYQQDAQELYEKIIDTASAIMHAQFASIQMLSPNGDQEGKLQLLAYRGFNQRAAEFWKYVDLSSGSSCGEALRTGKRIIVPDIEKCGFIQGTKDREIYLQTGIRAGQTTPLYSLSGRPVGMISTHWSEPYIPSESELRLLDVLARQAADVIDRRQFEQALQESEKKANALVGELEKADKNKNEFISVLSHELRNPLAAISAGIQLLDVAKDKNQTGRAKEIMKRQTNQLCRLVDDLLDLTRINRNKIRLKKETINLNGIVKGAVEDIGPAYGKKGVKLCTRIQTKPISLDADPVRIAQMIENILYNALKFTQANGVVRLTLKTEKNDAVISVKDNGKGISPEIMPQLFTPFTQAEHTLDRSSGGLGLGLSIVKGIVDLHGGDVSAYSEGREKGSTFTIRLPMIAGDHQAAEKRTSGSTIKKGLNVLIIEDNKDFAELLCSILRMQGHEISIAADGVEGIQKAKEQIPDVILCDIGLPGINGFEVAGRMREDINLKNVYLIALTGYAGNLDADLAKKSGFDMHLAKPVDAASLEKVLAEVKAGRGAPGQEN